MTDNFLENIRVSEVPVENHPQYMDHESVYKITEPDNNFIAFVGIHNTALGPGLGGIRYKSYANEAEALTDVLRLSEAMTWKNAAGGLDHGGGKSVIMAQKGQDRPSDVALQIMAEGFNIINKNRTLYYGAEDMNISEYALDKMLETTPYIKGASSDDPTVVSGNPSPLTAIGVFECMKVAVKHKLGRDSMDGVRVSLQGIGAVGATLAKLLHEDGAILSATDTSSSAFEKLKAENVECDKVDLDEIYDVKADVFAPNAIGGTLTDENIKRLKEAGVQIVCGAANNQQADQIGGSQSRLMHKLGILYCPDYIVNAAGVIWVAKVGENAEQITKELREGVPKRFAEILELAKQNPDRDLASIASEYARKRVEDADNNNDRHTRTA
ncbi:MAG: Glu/Leu/Phe/Val dehydrogenase [Alphaproteobacteria bacterium]|nr:Glu/Leu/Phe/Val dehydrogenase [Alphaproteobacteria bacterium]